MRLSSGARHYNVAGAGRMAQLPIPRNRPGVRTRLPMATTPGENAVTDFPADRIGRLTLGTAQLGPSYGIANAVGRLDDRAVGRLLDAAWESGISTLDTARSYGDAEERIGSWCRRTGHRPILVSKFPPLDDGGGAGTAVRRHFEASCEALGTARIDGYLAHRSSDILRPGVAATLAGLVDDGRLGAFGVSIYEPEELEDAFSVPGLGLVQAPVNLLDRRLERSGWLRRCVERGIFVFARSVFLQGLFFLPPDDLPPFLAPARTALSRLAGVAAEAGCDIATLALAAVRDTPGIGSVVIGVDSVPQLAANLAGMRTPALSADVLSALRDLGRGLPRSVIDPRRWPARPDAGRPGRPEV